MLEICHHLLGEIAEKDMQLVAHFGWENVMENVADRMDGEKYKNPEKNPASFIFYSLMFR